jgi:L-arabinose isomerase
MEESKAKMGIVFFVARWFDEVVLGKDENAKKFQKYLQEDTGKIIGAFSKDFKVFQCPLVTSMARAREAAGMLLSADIDAVLLCFVVWSEDEYLLPFADIMKIRPAILWVYTPYSRAPVKTDIMTLFRNSGFVASFESFGVLKKMDCKPFYVIGSVKDEQTSHAVKTLVKAAHVRKQLKTVKLGVLPYRNDQMIVTYVDEFRLYAQIGPSVDYISVLQLKKASDSIPDDQVQSYVREVHAAFRIDERVTEKTLHESARASLGMEQIMYERELDGLALSDLNPELHEVMGLRPCLYPEKLAMSEKVVGNEGDLGGTTAMIILQRLTGGPVMFTEIFNYDEVDNTVVAGHAGPANHLLSDEKTGTTITPDYELMDADAGMAGVWMEFIAKSGRVTMVNFISVSDGFQMTILGGESLGGALRIEGYPHCCIKIDPAMKDFIESNAEHGVSHHWAVVQGDVREELSALCDIMRVRKIMV